MAKRKRQLERRARAKERKQEKAEPKAEEKKPKPKRQGKYAWRKDELYFFPVYDVPRLVATIEDFPELVRARELRRRERERRDRMAEIRKEILAK